MKSTHTFSISFFLKKDKAKNGKAPLFVRITVDGAFADILTYSAIYSAATLPRNGAAIFDEISSRDVPS